MQRLLLFAALLVSTTLTAQVGEKNFIDKNYIEVTGKSEMEYTPDKIYIQVVLSENKKGDHVASLEQKMLQKLQELGIDTKNDVMIKDLVGNLWRGLFNRDVLMSKEYQIIVKDGKMAGQVFLALDKIDINTAKIEKLESSKIEEYRREVKIKAIKAAKEKAQLLAEAMGQKTGKALFVQEYLANAPAVYANTVMYKARTQADAADLNFEKLVVEATFLCRFELF